MVLRGKELLKTILIDFWVNILYGLTEICILNQHPESLSLLSLQKLRRKH